MTEHPARHLQAGQPRGWSRHVGRTRERRRRRRRKKNEGKWRSYKTQCQVFLIFFFKLCVPSLLPSVAQSDSLNVASFSLDFLSNLSEALSFISFDLTSILTNYRPSVHFRLFRKINNFLFATCNQTECLVHWILQLSWTNYVILLICFC